MIKLKRYEGNPILVPREKNIWENKAVFNAGAIYLDGKVHIIYRALSHSEISVFGYVSSENGFEIVERLNKPIYYPRIKEESKGCEDPRLTIIEDKIYMTYTAYDGNIARVALTTISKEDFLEKKFFNWSFPQIISAPGIFDKNACIIKVKDKFYIFHRVMPFIWIDVRDNLDFEENKYIWGMCYFRTREREWDSEKIGIAAPPIQTKEGWLLIFHGMSMEDKKYRLGAMLLDSSDPRKLIARLPYPILEPEVWYENEGLRSGTVFSCGAVIIKDKLFVYYGGADKYLNVATCGLKELLEELLKHRIESS
ncbi:MAG: glycosidase [Candidatus Aenigmarchaeota archaeon]|nr:glycosidase [Candidatus Aenigmarchaeota archaeon]MDW8149288.1 glycosidase [Candidatus Aenigmarchaeota archaeon]